MHPGIGILIIAIRSNSYGEMAYNLALSLKLSNPDIPIALITDFQCLSSLSASQRDVFDHQIHAKKEDYMDQGLLNPFMLKSRIYHYSPFESTLYLDGDNLFMHNQKSLTELMDSLKTQNFQMHEVKRYTKSTADTCKMIWIQRKGITLADLWDEYGLSDDTVYPEYNSSFIWWKKNKKNEKFFDQVAINYMDRRVDFLPLGKCYPDEMAWNLTSAQMKQYGEWDGYRPCFFSWENEKKDFNVGAIGSKYYFMTMAGGYHSSGLVKGYDSLVKNYRMQAKDVNQHYKFSMRDKIYFRK